MSEYRQPAFAEDAVAEPLADRISEELLNMGIDHEISVQSNRSATYPNGYTSRSLQGITRFGSVREFAAALERVGADASYSAGSGWYFREVSA